MSGNHQEIIMFLVLKLPHLPLVLECALLQKHNPQLDWVLGTITDWNPSCHATCLQSAANPPQSILLSSTEPPDLSSVLSAYHDLGKVFSKSCATSLPPHRAYDCSIELFPGTSPPRGRLYSMSPLEHKTMDKYIGESPGS